MRICIDASIVVDILLTAGSHDLSLGYDADQNSRLKQSCVSRFSIADVSLPGPALAASHLLMIVGKGQIEVTAYFTGGCGPRLQLVRIGPE